MEYNVVFDDSSTLTVTADYLKSDTRGDGRVDVFFFTTVGGKDVCTGFVKDPKSVFNVADVHVGPSLGGLPVYRDTLERHYPEDKSWDALDKPRWVR